MSHHLKKGDLVYVPQAVTLKKYNESGSVSKYIQLETPTTLLITNCLLKKDFYEVMYRGTNWLVPTSDTYPISG